MTVTPPPPGHVFGVGNVQVPRVRLGHAGSKTPQRAHAMLSDVCSKRRSYSFDVLELLSLYLLLNVFLYCCCCSVAQSCPTLCDPVDCSTPGFSVLHCLLQFAQTHSIQSVMPSNHLFLHHPLLLLPSIFPSIRAFPSQSTLRIRWPKDWNFRFIYLFTFGCAGCSLLCLGFHFVASGGYSSLQCVGFSLQWLLLL